MTKLRLFLYTLKNYIKLTPLALLATIIPLLIVGTLFWYTSANLYEENEIQAVNVGVVTEDIKDSWYNKAVKYLGNMDSTENTVTFIKFENMDQAYEAMETSEIMAIIYLPENVVNGILYGENIPAKIIFPKNINLGTITLSELTKSAAEFLSAAQAGTYTTGDLFEEADRYDIVSSAFDMVDIINFSYVLSREKIYHKNCTDLTSNINQTVFYAGSAIMLLLLFIGVSYNKVLRNEDKAFTSLLRLYKISPAYVVFCKLVGFTIILSVICSGFVFAASKYLKGNDKFNIHFSIPVVLIVTLLTLLIAAQCLFIFSLSEKISSCILAMFIYGCLMTILSGAIIPKVFFPRTLETFGSHLPTSYMHDALLHIMTGNPLKKGLIIMLAVYVAGFTLVTIIINTIKARRAN